VAVAAVAARQEAGAAELAAEDASEMVVLVVASPVEAADSVEDKAAATWVVVSMATGRLVEELVAGSSMAAAAGQAGAADRVASLAVVPAVELVTDWVAHRAAVLAVAREAEHGI